MHHNTNVEQRIQEVWKEKGLRDLAIESYGEENLSEVALMLDALSKTNGTIQGGVSEIFSVIGKPKRELSFGGENFNVDIEKLKRFQVHDTFFMKAMDLLHPTARVNPRSLQGVTGENRELSAGAIPSGILREVLRTLSSRE